MKTALRLSDRIEGDIHDINALVREAHHRISNNLSIIAGATRIHANSISKRAEPFSVDEVRTLLEDVGARVEAVACLHRLLSNAGTQTRLDIGDYLQVACEALISSISSGQMSFTCEFERGRTAPAETAIAVGLVMTEMVTNAVKYAHPAGVSGQIHVTWVTRLGDKDMLCVRDDGVGLSDGFDPAVDGGIGFRLMRVLCKQLGAELAFFSSPLGLTASLLTPISE
jgi:two-component sensor histidine kinase